MTRAIACYLYQPASRAGHKVEGTAPKFEVFMPATRIWSARSFETHWEALRFVETAYSVL